MRVLFNTSKRYVIIYSNDSEAEFPGTHERHRKFTKWVEENVSVWEIMDHGSYPKQVFI
jgi:hypothetical protein